jgi:hypothetical protein
VWVFYDGENVYVSFRAWESRPDRMIANGCAETAPTSGRLTRSGFRSTRFAIAQYDPVRSQRTRCENRRPEHERAAVQHRLESGLSLAAESSTAAGRSRPRSIQVDPLCPRCRPGLGLPGAAHQQVEERDCLSDHASPALGLRRADFQRPCSRTSSASSAAAVAHTRREAVRLGTSTDNTATPARA